MMPLLIWRLQELAARNDRLQTSRRTCHCLLRKTSSVLARVAALWE